MGGVGGTPLDHKNVSAGAIANAAAWASIGGNIYVVGNNNWTGGSGCAMGGGDLFAIKIDASYKNGVLEIRVPKPAQAKPKRFAVGGDGDPTPPTIEG